MIRNLTLANLAVTSLLRSPFMVANSFTKIRFCDFHNHINTVLLLNQYSHIIESNKFRNILNSAIIVGQSSNAGDVESLTDELIKKHKSITGDISEVKITKCLFLECKASQNGGGIEINTKKDVEISIDKTGFSGCKAEYKGGAIYAEGSTLEISKSCIDQCQATSYSLFYIKSSENTDIYNCFFSSSGSKQEKDEICNIQAKDRAKLRSFNFTNLDFSYGTAALSVASDEIIIKDGLIANCKARTILNVNGIHPSNDPFQSINFVKNTGKKYLISVSQSTTFTECAFVKDGSDKIVNSYSVFRSCIFSDRDPKFDIYVYTPNCEFDKGSKTVNFDNQPSDYCWKLVPKPDPEDPGDDSKDDDKDSGQAAEKAAIGVSTVVIIVCIVGIALFVFFLYKKKRNQGDNTLLMYSQV